MTSKKLDRAYALAGIPDMPMVRAHILKNITSVDNAGMLETMTSRQLSLVIAAVNKSWHSGRASCGASIEDDCVWVGNGVDKLLPLEILKQIAISEKYEKQPGNPNQGTTRKIISYKLEAEERR